MKLVLVNRKFVSSPPRERALLDGWDAADPSRASAR
jgi:hypothetical protein